MKDVAFYKWVLVCSLIFVVSLGAHGLSGSGDSAIGTLDTVSPTLDSVAPVTERSVSATFSEAMLDAGATVAGNYAVSDTGMGTLNANPDGVSGTGPYTLTWASGEMLSGASVTITASSLQDTLGNQINPGGNSATCNGLGIPPVFSTLLAVPNHASAGQTVTISVTCSETLETEPTVTVNGSAATWISGAKATDYTYEYVVAETDPLGMAEISVTGFDLAGNNGSLNDGVTLEIVEGGYGTPLLAWPLGVALAAAGIVVFVRQRRFRAALLVLALLASSLALADSPSVTNVTFAQGPDGAGSTKVDIYYDLVAPNGPCRIAVSLSKGGLFNNPVTSVSGDLTDVASGTGHHIVWDIRADYPEENIPNAQIRITAEDGQILTKTIMLHDDVPLVMVWIPAGTFLMGRYPDEPNSVANEYPQHQVTFAQGFWMGKYELTQQQWFAVTGTWPGTACFGECNSGADYPTCCVSWDDAKDFITTLNAYIISSGQGPLTMRLPSEAEWEYACRAGTQTRFYFGDSLGCAGDCSDCAAGVLPGNRSDYMCYCAIENMHVGCKMPNAFGLYDMSGNLCEMCEDDYHGTYEDAPADGSAWIDSPRSLTRVMRGGNWVDQAQCCRSAVRWSGMPVGGGGNCTIGFRLAAVQ